jgi:hypothetical protein
MSFMLHIYIISKQSAVRLYASNYATFYLGHDTTIAIWNICKLDCFQIWATYVFCSVVVMALCYKQAGRVFDIR